MCKLTPIETQIVNLINQGYTRLQVADLLGVSKRKVYTTLVKLDKCYSLGRLLELYKKFIDGLHLKVVTETFDTFGFESEEEVLRSSDVIYSDLLIWDDNLVELFKQIKELEENA